MKKLLILFFALICSVYTYAQPGFSMTIFAGSNGPWGENQYLTIDTKGKCKYILSEVNVGAKDSSSFTISKTGLKEINDAINQSRFMSLDKQYKTNMRDGSKIYISVISGRKSHSVELINKDIPQISLLLKKLNAVLEANKIHINY